MATITGTLGSDILTGTSGNDLFLPSGVGRNDPPDWMSGSNGGDTYDLSEPIGQDPVHLYVIDDQGSDSAPDQILGAGALLQFANLGYKGFTQAVHVGDSLHIVTPYRPVEFRDSGAPSYDITIVDHYGGAAIETLVAGGVSYALPTGSRGTQGADLMAGTERGDVLIARGGDDYVTGNGGRDRLFAGAGADHVLGGAGNDLIKGQAGNDWLYGGTGDDTVQGGGDQDFIYLEDGNDLGQGQAGNDYLYGQDGDDTLTGGAGQDMMSGGAGNDDMRGGADGDTYRYGYDVDALGSMDAAGHDIIRDKGELASWDNYDRIELFGYYGPSDGSSTDSYDRLSFARVGDDMVMTSDGGIGSITVRDQFGVLTSTIEELEFYASYWTPLVFKIVDGAHVDIGDDRTYSSYEGGEWNEILFGTQADDEVFGNSGTNFIWLGEGADTLIYKEADPELLYGSGGGACRDIVEDFDPLQDQMDFTEIKTITGMADLDLAQNAAGHATIHWDSGDFEVADILIELRGVTMADLGADHFLFA